MHLPTADFRYNIILTIFIAWLVAQTLKVIFGIIREKRFNFKWFVGTGGMPSSHASAAAATATAIGVHAGLNSPAFALALIFAVVVIFDAQGVRHASGRQAEILNKILDDIYWKHRIKEDRLKELIGHTPVEVLAGTLLGILIALFLNI